METGPEEARHDQRGDPTGRLARAAEQPGHQPAAIRLEALFGASAQFWLNLQLTWDLYHAQHAPEVKELRKRIKRVPVNARFDKIRAAA